MKIGKYQSNIPIKLLTAIKIKWEWLKHKKEVKRFIKESMKIRKLKRKIKKYAQQ